ncbi:hypothetical protein ABIB82_006502 [Bradyrhizobium sp. i1.8.4]|uniref:hypothetical protein n=1 Tax=unclassified Bradyrhizobium TaxID=2631580 RepID=UPI003D20D30C
MACTFAAWILLTIWKFGSQAATTIHSLSPETAESEATADHIDHHDGGDEALPAFLSDDSDDDELAEDDEALLAAE